MIDLIEGSGVFIYPLGLCSVLAVFIVVERLIALRASKTFPPQIGQALVEGTIPNYADANSIIGRILLFFHDPENDAEQLKAFARLQANQMERGIFILEIVIAAAPLLGLLGTVTGLIKVFARIDPSSGMPDPGAFVEGVALALTTTMIGLAVAIPALVCNSYLSRRIETLSTKLNIVVERLVSQKNRNGGSNS